jgi:hypothetical protein
VNWIIYTLKHPRTSEVRYVGFTLQTPKQRLGEHISEALRSLGPERRRSHKNNWVLSLLTIGLIPVLEVIEDGAGDGWKDTERHWIAGYQAAGARLVNAKHGGDGVIGYWGTAEQRTAAARRKKKVPLISRVMGRVMVDDSAPVLKGVHCLRFTGALNPNGYAQVSDGNYGRVYVHVVTWVDKHGPVPPGKELHHLCVNRWCCAWQHLEPITHGDHMRLTPNANRLKTKCRHGHLFSGENTIICKNGGRKCKICMAGAHKRSHARKVEAAGGIVGKRNSEKTHCPSGHEYTPENTHVNNKGSRLCLACRVVNAKRRVWT